MGSWLNGIGAVGIYNLMEDAATAEISRSQLWQWIHNSKIVLPSDLKFDTEYYKKLNPATLISFFDFNYI